MKRQGYKCPRCGNKKLDLMESNLSPDERKRRRGEETMLCAALVPKGQEDSFDEISDGTLICAYQWDPEDEAVES